MKYLLVTDMDGTIIPGDGTDPEDVRKLPQLLKDNGVILAYVTGRHLELVLEAIKEHKLPNPDFIVGDVGTTVYYQEDAAKSGDASDSSTWTKDIDWRNTIAEDWKGLTRTDIAALLLPISYLEEQEPERLTEFKQSYYTPLSNNEKDIVADIGAILKREQIKAQVVYSIDTKKHIGLVDILPENTAKDSAVRYLQQKLKIQFDDVMYAGDSGNDILPFSAGYKSVIVDNAIEPVKEEVRRIAKEKDIANRIYFAKKGCTSGVIEGAYHFKLFR